MTMTATFNEAEASRKCDEVLAKLLTDKAMAAADTMDDIYEACKHYVHITKAEFTKYADYCKAIVEDDGSSRRELTELELEFVAGGNWFTSACNWVKNKVVSVYNTVKNVVTDTWENGGYLGKAGISFIGLGIASAMTAVVVGVAAVAETSASAAK